MTASYPRDLVIAFVGEAVLQSEFESLFLAPARPTFDAVRSPTPGAARIG